MSDSSNRPPRPSPTDSPRPASATRTGQPPVRPAGAPRPAPAIRPAPAGTTVRPITGGPGTRPATGARPAPSGPGARPGGPGRPGGGPGRPGGGARPGGGKPGGGRSNGRPQGRGGAPTAVRVPGSGPANRTAPLPKETGPIELPSQITVKQLAEVLDASVNEIIRQLITQKIFANINEVVSYAVAAKVAEAIGYEPHEAVTPTPASAAAARIEALRIGAKAVDEAGRVERPPVVTVMGHVDHGKTSLLDAIRDTRVAAAEAGGITQHIGAYQVETNGHKITFLDTPGHEAFTQMRARGAQVTDIAVIVVAADDGVMPQTIEAIDHARAAQVPLVVAVNKIDKPGANPDHVKQQLVEHNVVVEDYGGDVVCVPVSAKQRTGITELLDMLILVAELQNLRANPNGPATGAIIEARLDPARGVTSTGLVQEGSLKVGDIIVAGSVHGKVRAMLDDAGKHIRKAGPSTPVSILGLPEVPVAGDRFQVVADERLARSLAEANHASAAEARGISLDTLSAQMREGKVKELNLLVKADVQGSLEALKHALNRIGEDHAAENLKVRLIHDAVGNVGEADVHLASASGAIIVAFNVKTDPAAIRLAAAQGVDIRTYSIIYKLSEDIEAALKGMLEPVYREQIDGHAEVLQVFKAGKTIIAGCRVTDGKIARSAQIRILRGGQVIHTGTIQSLRRGKDDVREVLQGYECGILMEDFKDFQQGDIIEPFSKVRV